MNKKLSQLNNNENGPQSPSNKVSFSPQSPDKLKEMTFDPSSAVGQVEDEIHQVRRPEPLCLPKSTLELIRETSTPVSKTHQAHQQGPANSPIKLEVQTPMLVFNPEIVMVKKRRGPAPLLPKDLQIAMDKDDMLKVGKRVCINVEEMIHSQKKTRYTLLANQIGEQIKDLRSKVTTVEARERAEAGSEGDMTPRNDDGRGSALSDDLTPYQRHMTITR